MARKIFPAAERAIKEIWHYTQRTWGAEQADRYVRWLGEAFKNADDDRSRWRTAEYEGVASVFYLKYKHQFLFFRELSQGRLGLIAVLHENMDLPHRLKNDVDDVPPDSGGSETA